jgi:hypothetical protein
MEAKRRKEKLLAKKKKTNVNNVEDGGHGGHGGHGEGGAEGSSDRTTRMLLAVLLLFLITEFPQGILGLLSGLLDESFFRTCYMPLGDFMDFAALLNSALNFPLYCAMSTIFRQTFIQTFHLEKYLLGVGGRRNGTTGNVRAETTAIVATTSTNGNLVARTPV